VERFHPDLLRPVEYIGEPHPISAGFGTPLRKKGLADYHAQVAVIVLNKGVPEDVQLHFETAKNLFVYGWFVYRFFTVADHQALAALELALRMRYEKEIPKSYYPRSKFATLKPLLRYAIDKGHIRHERFRRWNDQAEMRARSRYRQEKIQEMKEKGLDRIELDYSDIEVIDEDRNWEYLESLLEGLLVTRNSHAHGSTSVCSPSVATIELVAEVINQLFPVQKPSSETRMG
jgi:hypothetical protein